MRFAGHSINKPAFPELGHCFFSGVLLSIASLFTDSFFSDAGLSLGFSGLLSSGGSFFSGIGP
jgi:hypothetical protein